jgi:hypothetical protein
LLVIAVVDAVRKARAGKVQLQQSLVTTISLLPGNGHRRFNLQHNAAVSPLILWIQTTTQFDSPPTQQPSMLHGNATTANGYLCSSHRFNGLSSV